MQQKKAYATSWQPPHGAYHWPEQAPIWDMFNSTTELSLMFFLFFFKNCVTKQKLKQMKLFTAQQLHRRKACTAFPKWWILQVTDNGKGKKNIEEDSASGEGSVTFLATNPCWNNIYYCCSRNKGQKGSIYGPLLVNIFLHIFRTAILYFWLWNLCPP